MDNQKNYAVDTSTFDWINLEDSNNYVDFISHIKDNLSEFLISEGVFKGMLAGYHHQEPFDPEITLYIFPFEALNINENGHFYFTKEHYVSYDGYWVFDENEDGYEYSGICQKEYIFQRMESTIDQWQKLAKELKAEVDKNMKIINEPSCSDRCALIFKTEGMMDELGLIQDKLTAHMKPIVEKGEEISKKMLRLIALKCNEIDEARRNKYDQQIKELAQELDRIV